MENKQLLEIKIEEKIMLDLDEIISYYVESDALSIRTAIDMYFSSKGEYYYELYQATKQQTTIYVLEKLNEYLIEKSL